MISMGVVAANAERTGASLDRDFMMKEVVTGEASSGEIIHKAKYNNNKIILLTIL